MQREFGQIGERMVHAITLGGEGLKADVLTYGGTLRTLEIDTARGPIGVVLSLPDLDAYRRDNDYLGVLVGRFGNRIGGAGFELDDRRYTLSANEGRNHLHGGHVGFGRRIWNIAACEPQRLLLRYVSPDGEEGYPGQVHVEAEFLLGPQRLQLTLRARTDAPTPLNLTHHPYFNLAGDPAVPAAAQILHVPADHYLPVDDQLIPMGEIAAVAGTPFDFRLPATLDQQRVADHPQLRIGGGFDHCLVLADDRRCSAELYSPHSGVALRVRSSGPALQLYEGHGLDHSHPELGRGVCLEPQGFPDAPNRPQFPSTILRPGELYEQCIVYQFALPGLGADWAAVQAALDAAESKTFVMSPG
jgi:aldose 1-epimerase